MIRLLVGERVLTALDLGKDIESAGVMDGMLLVAYTSLYVDIFERTSHLGDERQIHPGATSDTLTRIALIDESSCLLIRQTFTKRVTGGNMVWDLCRGTYTTDANAMKCCWEVFYRRRREGAKVTNSCVITDSGWVQQD